MSKPSRGFPVLDKSNPDSNTDLIERFVVLLPLLNFWLQLLKLYKNILVKLCGNTT